MFLYWKQHDAIWINLAIKQTNFLVLEPCEQLKPQLRAIFSHFAPILMTKHVSPKLILNLLLLA
jgi:hypothetical protein